MWSASSAAKSRTRPACAVRKRRKHGSPEATGHGHVEGEEGLAALGLAADDAHGLVGPEALDEPVALGRHGGEPPGELDGEAGHRPRPEATGRGRALSAGGGAKTSKKSFSSSCLTSRCTPASRRSLAIVMSAR